MLGETRQGLSRMTLGLEGLRDVTSDNASSFPWSKEPHVISGTVSERRFSLEDDHFAFEEDVKTM